MIQCVFSLRSAKPSHTDLASFTFCRVKDLVVKYDPTLPSVLHGITFDIQPGEKIGLIGRTASGKSSESRSSTWRAVCHTLTRSSFDLSSRAVPSALY